MSKSADGCGLIRTCADFRESSTDPHGGMFQGRVGSVTSWVQAGSRVARSAFPTMQTPGSLLTVMTGIECRAGDERNESYSPPAEIEENAIRVLRRGSAACFCRCSFVEAEGLLAGFDIELRVKLLNTCRANSMAEPRVGAIPDGTTRSGSNVRRRRGSVCNGHKWATVPPVSSPWPWLPLSSRLVFSRAAFVSLQVFGPVLDESFQMLHLQFHAFLETPFFRQCVRHFVAPLYCHRVF